ncbi:MAG TPA: benzoate-CoA ligase family protein [Thermomicrobiales bacterium]|nr:benzoate-CoA ligase family protein [Thermomicrobiales bacterium]
MTAMPERYNASLLLDRNLEAGRGDKVAIYCEDERVTYGDLLRRVSRLGHALRALGLRREERVLLVLNDTPAFPVSFFAAIRAGAVPIPVNTLLGAADYRYFVADSGAPIAVVDAQHLGKVREAVADLPEPPRLIVANGRSEGAEALDDLLAAGPDELTPADTHRDDPAFWLYSSGSTGRPKGAVHLQHDILYTCETYARDVLEIGEGDVTFSASKLFHAYGLGNNLSFPYWAGATAVLHPGPPAPPALLAAAARHRPTIFYAVPTLYNAILHYLADRPDEAREAFGALRLCVSAAEALPPEIWRRWKEATGSVILDGIGSTEMLHIFLSNTLAALRPGSSGRPVPGYDARIVDDEGHAVPAGTAGYLQVRGDSAAAYYWRNHAKTKATMLGDWMATGDWYRADDEGFYWYEGRADDMMKVGGLWVSPVEVENALGEHPAVFEAAAIGVMVEGLARIKAVVVLRPGQEGSAALTGELQEWCKGRLKRYQYPHIVEYAPDLPKTVTGKIQRFKLRGEGEGEVRMGQGTAR